MLSIEEVNRIKREVENFRRIDIFKYIEDTMPWLRPVNHSLKRFSQLMNRGKITYALIGEYALNFYSIPSKSKEVEYAVENLELLDQLEEYLEKMGFRKLVTDAEKIMLLDLQMGMFLNVHREPKPLRWDDDMVKRLVDTKIEVKVLSPEDYAVSLIIRNGLRGIELAAKIFYLKLDLIDKDYLILRAKQYNVLGEVSELLEKIF